MSSRYVAAIAAWLLGAAIATAGSVIAVNELAHGLLTQPAQQLVATKAHESHATVAPSSSPAPSVTQVRTSRAPTPTPAVSTAPQTPAGTFLSSPDGSVVASCGPGGAYLQFWSPDPGFHADDVARGPAAVASVTFEGSGGGVVMRVSCPSGTPVAHLTVISPEPSPSPSRSDE